MSTIITREPTWERIGTDVRGCTDYKMVMQEAGLDYLVKKKPAMMRMNNRYVRIPGEYAVMRKDESKYYGTVKEKYTIVQNEEAFGFLSNISNELQFVKAGETKSGFVYIIAKLPDVNILGDAFTPHLIFSNDFAGKSSVRATICPLRIICQNQFIIAFKEASYVFSTSHTKNALAHMKVGASVLQNEAFTMSELNRMAEAYARMKVSPRQIDMVLNAMFKAADNASPEQLRRLESEKEKFRINFVRSYNMPDNYYFRGTAWGLCNVFADILTRPQTDRKTINHENIFVKTTLENGTKMRKLMTVVEDVVDKIA